MRKRVFGITTGVIAAVVMLVAAVIMVATPQASNYSTYANAPIITGADGSGSGTVADPFRVGSRSTLDNLVRVQSTVQNRHFVMVNDIDLAGSDFTAMNTLHLTSTFDGQGFAINNMALFGGGLFTFVNGTVRNLVFNNISTTTVGATRGAVAGTARLGSRFENISVRSGSINGTGNMGGIVGSIIGTGTTSTDPVEMHNLINYATMNAGTSSGIAGIVGRIAASVNMDMARNAGSVAGGGIASGGVVGVITGAGTIVNMTRVTNEATLNLSSWSGGIVGEVQHGGVLTLNWALNAGQVNGGMGGIVGSSWSGGTVTIRNSINNAPLTGGGVSGAITRQASAILTIENSWFNQTNVAPGINLVNNAAGITLIPAAPINTAGRWNPTTTTTQQLLDQMAAHAGYQGFSIDGDGNIILTAFLPYPVYYYTFRETAGGDILFRIRQSRDDATINLPNVGTVGFTDPTGIGFYLHGWMHGSTPVAHGTFTNTTGGNIEFTADIRAITYTINFQNSFTASNPRLMNGGEVVTQIRLGDNGRTLVHDSIAAVADLSWVARLADSGEYVTIAAGGAVVGFTLNTDFITAHAIGTTLYIRLISTTDYATINVAGPVGMPGSPRAGFVSLQLAGESTPRQIELGRSTVVASGAQVTGITATALDHFTLVDLINPVTLPAQALALHAQTINVTFAPVTYNFNIFAALRGEGITNPNPFGYSLSISNSDAITVGSTPNVSAFAPLEVAGYRFATWMVYIGGGQFETFNQGEFMLNWTLPMVTAATLDRFLHNGVITVVAEYIPTFTINVGIQGNATDRGSMLVTVIDSLTSAVETFTTPGQPIVVSYGSFIEIDTRPNQLYSANFESMEFVATENRNITIVFAPRAFEIVFEAYQGGAGVNFVDYVYGFEAFVGTTAVDAITIGSTISQIIAGVGSEREGFLFDRFTLYNRETGVVTEIGEDFVVTQAILLAHRNAHNQFVIIANYHRTFRVNIEFAGNSAVMGSFVIEYYNGGWTPTTDRDFIAGTQVRVVSTAHAFHTLVSDAIVDITSITTNQTITITFSPATVSIAPNLSSGLMAANYEDRLVGQAITLTANTPGGRVINNWTIAGRNVDDSSFTEAVRDGNTVTLTLSIELLATLATDLQGNFVLASNIDFALSTGVLMAIILPSVLIPLFLAAAIIYFVLSRRKYATVRAALNAERTRKMTLDTGGFIRDLKEGKSGNVTDKDVKDAMKKKKEG